MRLGDQQVDADRGRDDPRDDRQVPVGVGVTREATGVVAGAHRDARVLGGRAEVHPPQRRGLDERDHEAQQHRRRQAGRRSGRARHHDRLAERDDDEQLAALGEVAALDVVVGRRRPAAARQPVARGRRGELERERRDPQQQPLIGVDAARRPARARPTRRSTRPAARTRRAADGRAGAAAPRRRCARPAARCTRPRTPARARPSASGSAAAISRLASITAGEHAADLGRAPGRTSWPSTSCRSTPTRPRAAGSRRSPRPLHGEVAHDQVRQLRDREDVDEVEEQLDRRDRLCGAVAARTQVPDRRGRLL